MVGRTKLRKKVCQILHCHFPGTVCPFKAQFLQSLIVYERA